MLHVRVIAAPEDAERACRLFMEDPGATNVVHAPGYAREPAGDLVTADVASEAVSILLADLQELGIDRSGAITVLPIEVALSPGVEEAEARAPGSPSGAVFWEQLVRRSSEWTDLDGPYLVYMALASIIAAVGLLTDSLVLIVGAMILGPEFGPLAGLCVAVVYRGRLLGRRSLLALAVGFGVAALAALVFTAIGRATGLAPEEVGDPILTEFVSHPNRWSVVVALAAGVAGMLSLTTAKAGSLVGVLVSITTIPAVANAGLAAAYGDWNAVEGSVLQLVANIASIVVAGAATLLVQRAIYNRRRNAHLRNPARRAAGLRS